MADHKVPTPPDSLRKGWLAGVAVLALLLPACTSDGHMAVLGYCSRPNFDKNICTVRVPIFENRTFSQRIEFDLTRAVIREIEQKTPYKIVSAGKPADTELTGRIMTYQQNLVLYGPNAHARAKEAVMVVELTWKDLRTGEILSRRTRRAGDPRQPALIDDPILGGVPGTAASAIVSPTAPGDPIILPEVDPALKNQPPPPPLLLTSVATFHPELGQSITTATQQVVNQMATRIVGVMELPW